MTLLTNLPYLMPDKDRHGNPRLRVRVGKRKITIKEVPGTPEFFAAYMAAVQTLKADKVTSR